MTKLLTAAVAAAVLAVTAAPAAYADNTAPPVLTDGHGLTQVGTPTGSATNFVITVTTPQVAGPHHLRIILPSGYAADPAKRYPVFYFLHGSPDDPANPSLAFPAMTASTSMITVIPDGGARSWYTNWRMQNTPAGAQNWENFHLDQVIPFIDANLRTVAGKQGRAIGGLSMGGYGALHYAQHRPELFSQVATFSGIHDIAMNAIRGVVVATELSIPTVMCVSYSGTGKCPSDYGPVVDSDAIFGSPYPWWDDSHWYAENTSNHMAALAGTGITIYIGKGSDANPTNFAQYGEYLDNITAQHAKASLDTLGYPYRYVDYGNGANWGTQCDGGHTYGCWVQDLADYMPRLEQVLTAV